MVVPFGLGLRLSFTWEENHPLLWVSFVKQDSSSDQLDQVGLATFGQFFCTNLAIHGRFGPHTYLDQLVGEQSLVNGLKQSIAQPKLSHLYNRIKRVSESAQIPSLTTCQQHRPGVVAEENVTTRAICKPLVSNRCFKLGHRI
jgi:hypothetical protein